MSLENGKCQNCGGPLLLDASKEKVVCDYCGSEIVIVDAIKKIKVDGIADFDTIMLSAQRALDIERDADKAAKKYREALNLRPESYIALWGLFICESRAVYFWYRNQGYVQYPGDMMKNVDEVINLYGMQAYSLAPADVKPYYQSKINEFRSKFITTSNTKKNGCYIATAVYGSYNCPSVWVLRRYRDFQLNRHTFGRLFIKFYYATSPTFVKLFGKTKWFNKMWKNILDKKIIKLRAKGYSDLPYYDLA